MIDEAREEQEREMTDAETNEDAEYDWSKEAEKSVQDAVKELEREGEDQESQEASEGENNGEHGGESDSGRTEDTESYHDGGGGQMYATKTESSEHTESKTESETTEETQDAEQEPAETHEGSTSKENTGPKNTQSESEEPVDSEEGETEGHLRNTAQDTTERPESPETSTKDEAETDTQEKEMRKTTTSEYSAEDDEAQDEIEKGKKIETSSKSDVHREHEASVESSSEPEHEETKESKSSDESERTKHQTESEGETKDFDDSAEKPMTGESTEQESEPTSEEREKSEPEGDRPATSKTEKDEIDEFAERVKEILDETPELDDNYDYVQDPLTGELQRVPKILADYETDEQKQKRKLRNIFAELSEEERERFKDLVRESAESEEDSSAEAVEKAWTNIVTKAEKERGEIDVQEVHQLYFDHGLSMLEVGRKLGFKSTRPIQRVFKEQGWEARRAASIIKGESIAEQIVRKRELKPKENLTKRTIDSMEVYNLYFVDGLTMMEISKKLGFKSAYSVSQLFKELGWKPLTQSARKKKKDFDVLDVFQLYYIEGLTKEGVAEELDIPYSRLRKVFKEMRWPTKIRQFETQDERALAKKEGAKKTSQRIKDLREEKFGTKCRLCGQERKLAIHKKDGIEHERDLLWRIKFLRSVDTDDWAALCIPCHRGVHWLMESLGHDWDDIESLAQRKQSSKPKSLDPLSLPEDDTPSSNRYLELKSEFEGNYDELRKAIFGNSCNFCGARTGEKKIPIHRKDGRDHPGILTRSEKYYRTLNPDEWVSLCSKHHRYVHWAMDTLNLKWDDLKSAKNGKMN